MHYVTSKLDSGSIILQKKIRINNSESEIRKLLNYCELNWDENCLNHHQSKKTMIKTVSTYQARKPIYKTSIDSNKYYMESLEKYFNQLNYK